MGGRAEQCANLDLSAQIGRSRQLGDDSVQDDASQPGRELPADRGIAAGVGAGAGDPAGGVAVPGAAATDRREAAGGELGADQDRF